MPSASRFTSPSGAVTKRGSERRSVTRRLTSSGIVGSKERRPASTCATGTRSLARRAPPQRGVHVPIDDDAVWSEVHERLLQRRQQGSRLRRKAARADAEVQVGLRKAELLEEDVRQAAVVVLDGWTRRCSTPAAGQRR
jgi:hypothetical protein